MLTSEQIIILGVVATVLTQVYKILMAKYKDVKIDPKWLKAVTAGISLILALVFIFPTITGVTFDDPMKFLGIVVTQISAIFGLATLIYAFLFKKIADDMGWNEEKFLKEPNNTN